MSEILLTTMRKKTLVTLNSKNEIKGNNMKYRLERSIPGRKINEEIIQCKKYYVPEAMPVLHFWSVQARCVGTTQVSVS